MLAMIQDLVRHKWYANAALLNAVRRNDAAAQDDELHKLFHHILVANRYWLFLILQREFAREEESRTPGRLDELIAKYRHTETLEMEWLSQAGEPDLDRGLQSSFLPGRDYSVAQAVIQVAMHSLGHRAQGATRLRALGGTPPTTDFILWLKDRPAAEWPPEHR